MLSKNNTRLLILWSAINFISIAKASTGVGSGGDVIDLYLESTRLSLLDSLESLVSKPSNGDSLCDCKADPNNNPLCGKLRALTPDQRQLCRAFILETASEIITLNLGRPSRSRVPFLLSMEPITVADPNGNLRPVSAATPLGPDGPITFHYDSVRMLSPMFILALIAHEFGHKATFRGEIIDDNPIIAAFDFPGGGRALLDAVGAGVAWYASTADFVGREFGVMDTFTCDVLETTSNMGLPAMGDSQRLFLSRDKLDAYETGIGFSPRQLPCNWRNDQATIISFQLKIHEDQGCSNKSSAKASRYTTIETWIYHLAVKPGDTPPPPEKLREVQMKGFNPICEADPTVPIVFDLAYGARNYHVEMRYRRSTGRIE